MTDGAPKPSAALFDVYLRLRPSFAPSTERFLDVEEASSGYSTHITIKPPANDHRKRAIERFAFTKVFQEDATQLDLFKDAGVPQVIAGVVGKDQGSGRDGVLATLGVTGSGKSHTILGSKAQRGLTQLSLDVLFQALDGRIADAADDGTVFQSLCAGDVSEAQLSTAPAFLESVYGDGTASNRASRAMSRGATPMRDASFLSVAGPRKHLPRVSTMPQSPSVEDLFIDCDENCQYAVVVSMYEVYNDRIFDLLAGSTTKTSLQKRRGLLFKSTESSPDRKVVAGLRKIVCGSLDEALLVLETGLVDRRVAGTGSNAASSRSHGFFCVEVKKRPTRSTSGTWKSSTLTIVDLAGSERARTAKTTGSTLAEAGKINESLMYLGQCMQLQSDNSDVSKPLSIVPFRQCKLTELLFSNSFPSTTPASGTPSLRNHPHLTQTAPCRQAQKSIMIVTADPLGDFNATSQILRYSALAREVTVPRIPSVSSSILSGTTAGVHSKPSGRSTPSAASEDLEAALAEILRLRSELELVGIRHEEEVDRRRDAEAAWVVATERCERIEAEVREEVYLDFEERLGEEMRRWRDAAEDERERDEARLDKKLDILAKGIEVFEDPAKDGAERIAELEVENRRLRELMEREKGLRSPSKKMRVLKTRKWNGSGVGFEGSP